MISLILLAATPAPPPPITRQSGLTEYAAQCLVVGRNGQVIKLNVDVRGQLAPGIALSGYSPRTMGLSTGASELRSLNKVELQSVPVSHVGWSKRWETSDFGRASIGSQPVVIKLVSQDDLAMGVGIEIQVDRQMTVPLYAGMCRAKSAREASQS